MTLELCIFRHGRTFWNAENRFQGHADVDLDELGLAQALVAAERARHLSPKAIYSSDLKRCHYVASRMADATGLEVRTDKRLRERDFGAWSGLTRDEVIATYPEEYEAWKLKEDVRAGGGESSEEIMGRARSFFDDIRNTYDSGPVIVVSHGGWIREAVQMVLTGTTQRIGLGVVTQASLTVVEIGSSAARDRLIAYNDRGHLLNVEPVDSEPPAPSVF